MIYVAAPYDKNSLMFPRTTSEPAVEGKCGLTLRSSVGRRVLIGPVEPYVVGDYFRVDDIIFCVDECRDSITPGEWEYQLTSGDYVLSSGIIRFGPLPFGPEPEQYNNETTYDQYNANAGNDY